MKAILAAALLLSMLICITGGGLSGWTTKKSIPTIQNATAAAEQAFSTLDKIENGVENVSEWTKTHREAVKCAIGTVLLLYGGHFANTMLFIHTLYVSSLPTIQKSLTDLASTYKNTRKILKEEYPQLLKIKEQIVALKSQIEDCEVQYKTAQQEFRSKSISVSQCPIDDSIL